MNLKKVCLRAVVLAVGLVVLSLAGLSGCDNAPAGIALDDLTGWMVVSPNPVGVGEPCTRNSFMYNSHATDTAFVDSLKIDTLRYVGFHCMPGDTIWAVEEMGRTYQSAGTYIHTLTYFTRIGILTCPPCTVIVE